VGDVISLAARRFERHQTPSPAGVQRASRVTFYFDLSSPFTYLAAERVDRRFASVTWRPVLQGMLQTVPPSRALADERARALGMPLVWPEVCADSVRPAMRVASLAAERGRAAAFVLAASRLAYCGGFELDHPEVLAEAAAAASLGLEDCLQAAGDASRDGVMEEGALKLLSLGVTRLPAVRVGRTLFAGEDRLGEAVAASLAPSARAV
jgi:2-hydroxychromene-2-carboxylate isomerase